MPPDDAQPDRRSTEPSPALTSLPTHTELATTLLEATRRVLRRRFRVVLLIRDAYAHMEANAGALAAVWADLGLPSVS